MQSPIPRTMELTPEVDLGLRENTVIESRASSTGVEPSLRVGGQARLMLGRGLLVGLSIGNVENRAGNKKENHS